MWYYFLNVIACACAFSDRFLAKGIYKQSYLAKLKIIIKFRFVDFYGQDAFRSAFGIHPGNDGGMVLDWCRMWGNTFVNVDRKFTFPQIRSSNPNGDDGTIYEFFGKNYLARRALADGELTGGCVDVDGKVAGVEGGVLASKQSQKFIGQSCAENDDIGGMVCSEFNAAQLQLTGRDKKKGNAENVIWPLVAIKPHSFDGHWSFFGGTK